ncbi:MAG TPA: hypothetical protein VEF35_03775 [Candidatus Bathyarchaeia archaeon]|nr:hypothetical protein [Candidatus Bathyarchaeia archaeon]
MAFGAEEGIEVRIDEETHDSIHRYRRVDVSAAFAGAAPVGQEGRKRP